MATSISEVAIPGGWSEREVTVAGHTFRMLVPADPDEFLNHLAEPYDTTQPHLADPYWAKLWPAALPLAEAIVRARQAGRSPYARRVLELGCGSGLVGLACLAAGLEVTFSDYVPAAVELALENAARNGFPGVRGLVLDWRHPLPEQWPLIVASDVIYDRSNLPLVLNVLDQMLAPEGEAWLGDVGRGPAAEFLRQATDRGWSVTLLDERDRPAPTPLLGRYQRFVLRR